MAVNFAYEISLLYLHGSFHTP